MKKIIIGGFVLMGLISSCSKSMSDEFVAYAGLGINDTVWTKVPISQGLLDTVSRDLGFQPMADTVNAAAGGKIKFNDSLNVSIPAGGCADASNNAPITGGTVKVELLSIRKKGDFIRYMIPTTSGKYLLESAGAYYLKLTRGIENLVVSPNATVTIKFQDFAPTKTDYGFFVGVALQNRDSLFTWLPAGVGSSPYGSITPWDSSSFSVPKRGYFLNTKLTNWISADRFLDTVTQARTRINVTMQLNYTNKNTVVFAVFKNQRTVVRLTSDYATRSFYSLNFPVNSAVTLVSISLIDNTYYFGTKDVTVVNANNISLTADKKSLSDISTFLDSL